MPNKWTDFEKTNSSTIDIAKPHKKGNADDWSLGDWQRESKQERFRVNGVSLKELAQKYDYFESGSNVEDFFKKEILNNFNGTDEQKNQAVEYLRKTFHQGGLMYPVNSALSMSIKTKDDEFMGTVDDETTEQVINIKTTLEGFKVQEFVSVYNIMVCPGPLEGNGDANNKMSREDGKGIIQAYGIVNVDFSGDAKEPTLSIESNKISLNHPLLSEHMDDRGFGQKIVDFLKNLVGLNKVQYISPKTEEIPLSDIEEISNRP